MSMYLKLIGCSNLVQDLWNLIGIKYATSTLPRLPKRTAAIISPLLISPIRESFHAKESLATVMARWMSQVLLDLQDEAYVDCQEAMVIWVYKKPVLQQGTNETQLPCCSLLLQTGVRDIPTPSDRP